jgi:hypothetical protein
LTKEPTLRLVLLLLGKGTRMPEHQTAGPLTLQVLSGLVAFRAGDRTEEVGDGRGDRARVRNRARDRGSRGECLSAHPC